MNWQNECEINALLGKTLTRAEQVGDDEIYFETTEGETFKMYHAQDCCEIVTVEDIAGDLSDLVGQPILQAEASESNENPPGVTLEYQDSFTWTFYKLATIKGGVTIRWYGESNGYYSEGVSFGRVPS